MGGKGPAGVSDETSASEPSVGGRDCLPRAY